MDLQIKSQFLKRPHYVLASCLMVVLSWTVAPTVSAQQGTDRFFPVVTDKDKLPKFAIARLGQKSQRTLYMGVYNVRFSRDGKYLAIKARDHIVRIFEMGTFKKLCEVDGHDNSVTSVEFSPDGKTFLTAGKSDEERIIFWETETGKEVKRIAFGADAVRYSDDGQYLYALRSNRLDRELLTGGERTTKQLAKWSRSEFGLGMSPKGNTVATSSQRAIRSGRRYSGISIRSFIDGATHSTMITGLSANPKKVTFSADDRWILARYDQERRPYLWDRKRSKKMALDVHENPVLGLGFSTDSRFFVTMSSAKDKSESTAYLWDTITATNIHKFTGHDFTSNLVACGFSPDGRYVTTCASGRRDSSMLIWDLNQIVFGDLTLSTKKIESNDIEEIWKELGSSTAATSLNAVKEFVRHHPTVVKHVSKRINDTTNIVDQTKIAEYILQLNDKSYDVRHRATEKLRKLRNAAEAALRKALKETKSVETRYRVTSILKTPLGKPKINAEQYRRFQRAIHALELSASPPANQLLQNLADGHPHIDLANEARDALERIRYQETLNKKND